MKNNDDNSATVPATIKTKIHINLNDRLYLALARKEVSDKLIYVYTFGCPGQLGRFCLNPSTDIATFTNPKNAELYVNTISNVMHAQSVWPIYSMFRNALKAELEIFNKMTK